MVTVDKAVIAKIEKNGKHFEILVDPQMAYDLRSGKQVSISGMLAVNDIFKDSKKGLKVGPVDLEEAFETLDIEQITEIIVKEGDVQLTTEFRKKRIEEKKKQIAEFISSNAMDPQTKVPHPIERILNSMDQAGIHVDPFVSADKQIDDVIEAIKSIIPISMERISFKIKISATYAAQSYGILKSYSMAGENWLPDGSLVATVSMPAGMKDEFYAKLNKASNGEAEIQEEN